MKIPNLARVVTDSWQKSRCFLISFHFLRLFSSVFFLAMVFAVVVVLFMLYVALQGLMPRSQLEKEGKMTSVLPFFNPKITRRTPDVVNR